MADGRVVAHGARNELIAHAGARVEIIEAPGRVVIPGLHDAHLHLVELARSRRALDLVPAQSFDDLLQLVTRGADELPSSGWLHGRGWSADSLPGAEAARLGRVVGARLAFLASRDGHSAWVSPALLARAGIDARVDDPTGGHVERDRDGSPNGIVRETAVDLVRPHVDRISGEELRAALDEVVAELNGFGITAVTDAGDFMADGGAGRHAAMGDSFSTLAAMGGGFDRRLRVTANLPVDALDAAIRAGLHSGQVLPDAGGITVGWVKAFADGALGSRTAALFEPYTCAGAGSPLGVLTITPDRLDEVIASARSAAIGVAVHAIGDRANALVIDAFERAGPRSDGLRDRIEHVQLTRPADRGRIAALGLVASMQPIHCPSDAAHIERCWAGREPSAYAWCSLAGSGVRLAFGSDAPVEAVNPWLGIHAAVNRRGVGEAASWQPQEALSLPEALAGYTSGPAHAAGRPDHGTLRIGARADLAVLDCSLETLLEADDALAEVRAELTLLAGVGIPRGDGVA